MKQKGAEKKEEVKSPYDRYACPVPEHLGTRRKYCPICGAIYCPKCDINHMEFCREQNNVGT